MDSSSSSFSTLVQPPGYQSPPANVTAAWEAASTSLNGDGGRDDADTNEERVVAPVATKCKLCRKILKSGRGKCSRHTAPSDRLDASPVLLIPLPGIEAGQSAETTTLVDETPPNAKLQPSHTVASTYTEGENVNDIPAEPPTEDERMIQTSGGITYEHATLPSAQHAEKRPLNIVEPQSDHPDTLPGLEIPSRHLDANMNTGPQPSLPPPVSAWDSFVSRRPQLLQEAIRESVGAGTFHDVDLYAYSTRSKISHSASAPTVVHARTSFLEAPSCVLKDLLANERKQPSSIPSTNYDHEYLDDSDLEDEELEDVDSMDEVSDISDIASDISAFDLLDSPQSTAHTAIDTGARDVECDSTAEHVPHEEPLREVIYAPFGAARTWRALVLYLYDGHISFSPLQTSAKRSKGRDDFSCSPKSMYYLAKKLDLDELAKVCEEAIIADLRASNIAKELFSNFTWRHPAILGREVIVFKNYSQDVRVRTELKQAFQDIASGKLPRRDVVLSALFDNLLPPVL